MLRAATLVLLACVASSYASCAYSKSVSLPTGEVISTSNFDDGNLEAVNPREELVYRKIQAPLNFTWICLHFVEFDLSPGTSVKVFVNDDPDVSKSYYSCPERSVQCFEANYVHVFYQAFIIERGFVMVAAPTAQGDAGASYHHLEDGTFLVKSDHSLKLDVLSPGVYSGEQFETVSGTDSGYGSNQLISWRFTSPASPGGLQWICIHFTHFSTEFGKDKLFVFTDEISQSSQFSGVRKPFSVCRQTDQLNVLFTSTEERVEGGVLGFVTYSRDVYEAPKRVQLSPLNEKTMSTLLRSKRARYRFNYSNYYNYQRSYYNYGYNYGYSYGSSNGLGIGLGIGIPAIIIVIVSIIVCCICCNKKRSTIPSSGIVYNASTGQTQALSGNGSTYPTTTTYAQVSYPAAYSTQPFSGTTAYPAGTTAYPGVTTAYPSGTTAYPAGTTAYPAGTTAYPAGTTPYPAGTTPYPTGSDAPYPGAENPLPYSPGTVAAEPSLPPPSYHEVSKPLM